MIPASSSKKLVEWHPSIGLPVMQEVLRILGLTLSIPVSKAEGEIHGGMTE